MSKTSSRLALIFSLVGLVASGAATYTHYRMLADPTYTSFCDVSATWSCTEVYRSVYGSFMGIPVALFGGIWFAFATLLSLAGFAARPDTKDSVSGYLFLGSTLALAVVLFLAYASFVRLGVKCPLCVITYVAVIGLFIVSGAASSLPMLSLPKRAASDLKVLFSTPLALLLALLWAGGSVSLVAFFPREASVVAGEAAPAPSQDQRSQLERFMATAPRVPLAVANDGAKVLIVKFADYQCPACSQAYQAYKPILAKYATSHPGQVKMVMKDYPLDMACNTTMRQTLHGAACDAAVAVRLAAPKNRAEQLEEWLYTHQPEMTPASVRQAAKDIGQVTDFEAKYAATIELVKGDIALGQSLRVSQTPTFFINGIKIDGAWAPQFFDQAIAYELQRAQ